MVEYAGGVVRAEIGDTPVVVFATEDGLHGYRDPGVAFDPAGDGSFHGDGTTWDGATGRAADGRRLERVPAKRLYAFTRQDDHGPDAFYDG